MKNYCIGIRALSLFLAAVMLLSMIPAIGVTAATIDEDGYLGSVKLLNNDESITLPIKLNNFAMDGMLFEYLSSVYNNTRDSRYFLYETGGVYQLFSLHLAGKKVGIEIDGDLADKDGLIQPDTDAMSGVDLDHSLTSPQGTATSNYKGVTSGGTEYQATLYPASLTDGAGAKYLQLRQTDRDSYAASARTWRKLTRFSAPKTMDKSRYAVIIYRVNGDTYYDNMLLTWNSYDELSDKSNCSQAVKISKNVNKTANANWQYAIIDLAYNLGSTEAERAAAAAGTTIEDIYLKAPLNYFIDGYDTSHKFNGTTYPATGNSMDLAAVAYFPYYGDAEQFAHYGLTLGCDLKYYYRDNRGFDFINPTRTSSNKNAVSSVSQWDDNHFGNQLHTTSGGSLTLQDHGTTEGTVLNTVTDLSYALFGEMNGTATLGLLETQLDANGRPVYKEVVVNFVATYLRNRLTAVEEYPSDNYGWKNYSFVTGVSTTSDVDEHLFGKDDLGHSIDLATALCDRVAGAQKGSGTASGTMGTYAQTRAKANELVGTWDDCEGNIETWFDAAYYLLHNLYVTDKDAAYDGDSYGEYENDFQKLVMGQVDYKDADGNVIKAYAFDSGFCKNYSTTDTAVIYDRDNHTLTMDPAADTTGGRDPFLPSSGTGTEIGETNSPYYIDDYVIQHGRGYRKRDYLYTISGNGSFQFDDGLFFEFKGDDDVYLFINGQLVLDIGGTHAATLSKIQLDDYVDWAWAVKNGTSQYKGLDYEQLPDADRARIDALALEKGSVYSFDFFYMERHGAGANLRIVTNIQVTGEGLNVDKTAYQNGIEIAENGIVNVEDPIEYAFKITNDSEEKLHRLTFQDTIIGVSIDYLNGLQIAPECVPYVKNASGDPLTAADLEILVSGKDSAGNDKSVIVTCKDNDELKTFLADLSSDDGTQSGDGLWSGASIRIRGIYYSMTDEQKEIGSFRNYVTATATGGGVILRGADDHTVYQPGRLAYYQWVDHPVVIERERFYYDLLEGTVADAEDLPALGNMILVPSDADGVERQDDGLVNTRGGDVYLEVNYKVPRTYVAYVTILDQTDPDYSLTVPVTVYVTDTKDLSLVLDYGLDVDLTEDGAIFDYELDLAVGENVTGTLMGLGAGDNIPSYQPYNTDSIETAVGNTVNELTYVKGTYSDGTFANSVYQLDSPIYLEHTKPWVVEFNVGYMKYNDCLLSAAGTKMTEDKKERLYLTNNSIGLGYSDGTNELFYGVPYSNFRGEEMTTVKLFNVPAGDGTNMVYCSVNGEAAVAMNNVYVDRVSQNNTDSSWINGRDFTFEYLGCNGHAMYLKMDYLRVYQDGKQLTNYRWESNGTNTRWELDSNVVLNSDRAWEIEFEMQLPSTTSNFMLFSSTEAKVDDKTTYVYIVPGKRFVSMGSNVGGTYINYGALLPEGFDLTASHSYLLKNRINADGTNMAYLYVDRDENGNWTEVGPLNYYSEGSNIGTVSTGLSGKNFSFRYIGGYNGFSLLENSISYIEVREDTALRTAYEWKATADQFESIFATGDGNRINFVKEDSNIVEDGDGKLTLAENTLKFELFDFMEQVSDAYVALTIHDRDFVPTSLDQSAIDVAKEVQMFKKLTFIPANVVYYEDDFPAIHYVTGNKNVFELIGSSTLDKSQSLDQNTEYGSDPFYQNDSADMSGGHITKIAIQEDKSRLAWFEFKGTGFELVSSTDASESAMLYLEVFNRADVTIADNTLAVNEGAKAVQWIPLITEFDHDNDDGDEVIHQVPIIRWQKEEDLVPGEYVVIINGYATYDFSQIDPSVLAQTDPSKLDELGAPMVDTYLYIDGIRIFQPMGYSNEHYADVENKVIFDELRDHIMDTKVMACEKTDAGIIINSGTVTWTENFTGLDYTGAEFVGNQVENVNDYLLKGPNNEIYMDGTSGKSSLAFVVYKNTGEADPETELGLQIAVRAIDAGNFYGTGSTGLKANLQLGVMDANGTNSWMHLAEVTSGTEQYFTIPYELCPVTLNGETVEYNVIIRVVPADENASAMVSFSSLKRAEGLELKEGIGEALTIYQDNNGQWVTPEGDIQDVSNFLMVRSGLMAENVIAYSEAVPGENFVHNTVTPENTPAILPQYPTLSFEGEVRYHVYYTLQNLEGVALEDMGLITFDTQNIGGTITDATDVIPGAVFNGEQYTVHTNGIPAKNLGDTLYFKVYAKLSDGSYVYSDVYHYSAKMYAEHQLSGTSDEVKHLVVAMLNYGAAAQKYFNYKTDTLMNADLTAEQQALICEYSSDMATAVVPVDSSKVGMFASSDGFARMYPAVTFGGAFAIDYFMVPSHEVDEDITLLFWDAETYENATELSADNALGSKKMTSVAGTGEYHAAYTGIAAKDIGDTVYVAAVYESNGIAYGSGVLAYSLSQYCKGFAEAEASAEQTLAAATMVYGCYAEQYFAE